MTKSILGLSLLLLIGSCGKRLSGEGEILIQNTNVVDVKNGFVLHDYDVLIQGDSIAAVAPAGRIKYYNVKTIYNGENKYVIPGLWDMHVHPDDPEMWRMNPVSNARDLLMPLFVVNGVTGVRDMAGDIKVIRHWENEFEKGQLLVPRIVACGPLIDGPNPMWDGSVGIKNVTAVPTVVDSLVNTGSDFLKIYSLLPRDIFFELADYAREKRIPFAGHVPFNVLPSEAAARGMKSQEHLLEILKECTTATPEQYAAVSQIKDPINRSIAKNELLLETFDQEKALDLIESLVGNNVWITPTLSMWVKNAEYEEAIMEHDSLLPYLPDYMRKYWTPEINDHLKYREREDFITMKKKLNKKYLDLVNDMVRAGVKMMAGTDMGANPLCFPGWSLHWELEIMETAMLPEEVLRSATIYPAEFLDLDDKYGSIEVGKKADLVILNANPLTEISNTKQIQTVIFNGVMLSRDSLDNQLTQIKKRQTL